MSKVKITGKVLVVQLGREETRIVLMGKGSEILRSVLLPTPAEAVEDGMIRNPDAVREMLKAALKEDPQLKHVRQVVFSLRTSQVITENVMIPELNAAKTEKLIQSNLDTYFPVDITDYRVVWQQLGSRKDENGAMEQCIQLWAVPNAILNRYYLVANGCGLSVAAIDYCGNSLATACGVSFACPNKVAREAKGGLKLDLNMEIGLGGKKKKEAEVTGAPAATATRTVPSTNLYVSLDKDLLGMTFSQNGRVVYQRFIRCGADPSYQFSELAMMVEYYSTMENSRGSTIRGVVLGALADDDMLVSDLQDALGIALGRFRGDCAPGLVFCVGAGRTTMDFGVASLNRVATARTQMVTQLWQYGVILAGGLALVAVVMFTLSARLVWKMDITSLNTTKQALQVQAAKVAGFADNYYQYENNYNSYSSDWETVFSSLRTYNDNLVLMLSELESIVPENSSVTNMQIAADGMNVTFACKNKEEAAYLIMALRKLQYADLNSISNLSGGGGGPATSYGSGEKAPTEGGSGSSAKPGTQTDASLEDILDADGALADFVASEITPEELRELAKELSREDICKLEEIYGKAPGADAENEPGKLDALKQQYADKTEAEQQELFEARSEALRSLLTTDLFAGNRFLDLLEEDIGRDEDALLWWLIIDDLVRLKQEGKLETDNVQDLEALSQRMDDLVDVLVQDEAHLSATEALICTDEYMENSYMYYLEVELGLRPAEQMPWLDMEHVMEDMLDGGLNTGDDVLDERLNGLVADETWELLDTLDTEEGVQEILNNYFCEGSTGNVYLDGIVEEYLSTGTSGNVTLDQTIEGFLDSDYMVEIFDELLNEYASNGTTGNTVTDQLIQDYLNGGTGNDRLDAVIEGYYTELMENMDAAQVGELLEGYLNEGTTGNPVFDKALYEYLTNGTTGVENLDAAIKEYLENMGSNGNPFADLTDAELEALMNKYLTEGTTGNAVMDQMMYDYIINGTTGNAEVDKLFEDYLNGLAESEGNFAGLTDEQITELMNKYLTTGTTGNSALDQLIMKYIMQGTTGIPALDQMILDYMSGMGGNGGNGGEEDEKPGTVTKEQLEEMLNKYLEEGTTGNSLYDELINKYLTTGTTGNPELDKMIEDYLAENSDSAFTKEMVYKMMEDYLEKGTTGNPIYDEWIKKYLKDGTTGNHELDKLIKECMEEMLGIDGELTPEVIGELLNKYLTTGTTGSPELDKLIYNYITKGTTGIPELDKMIEDYLNSLASGNGGNGGNGGLGGIGGGMGGGQDTRIYFTVSLGYKDELKSAELARKGLYYDDKISKLEVEE